MVAVLVFLYYRFRRPDDIAELGQNTIPMNPFYSHTLSMPSRQIIRCMYFQKHGKCCNEGCKRFKQKGEATIDVMNAMVLPIGVMTKISFAIAP